MTRVLLLACLAGCVGKGRHELVEVQLDATRTALSARTAQSAEDLGRSAERVEGLTEEVRSRQQQLDALAVELDATRQELATLAETHAALLLDADEGPPPPPPDGDEPPPPLLDVAVADVVDALAERADRRASEQRLASARAQIEQALAPLVEAETATLHDLDGWVVVRIATGLLFQESWTTLSPRGQQTVEQLAGGMGQLPGFQAQVVGHTDARPMHSADFPSNWDRGFSRGLAVLRGLEALEVPTQLSVASFAGSRPLLADDPDNASNRRVEIWIRPDPELRERFEPTPEPEPEPEPEPAEG